MKNIIAGLKANQPKPKVQKNATVPPENLDLERGLVKAIDDVLEASNGTFWKQSDTFAPSSTNQCARYFVYRFRGFNQTQDFRGQTKRIFDLGNKIEDSVGQIFDDLGILRGSQLEMKIDDPPVKGYIDFLIEWEGEKVVECKSINEAGFEYRRIYHKPKDEHFRQIQCYLKWGNWDEGFLFYYCKNNSAILPLLVKRDDEFLDKLFDKYRAIYEVHKNGDLPVRPYKKESEKCRYCDAKEHCWSDTEVGVKITRK